MRLVLLNSSIWAIEIVQSPPAITGIGAAPSLNPGFVELPLADGSITIGDFLHPAETPRLAREIRHMITRARDAAMTEDEPPAAGRLDTPR